MTTPNNAPNNQPPVSTDPDAHENKGSAEEQVQAKMDQETERGYRGVKVDPTPDEHYTVAGVVAGLPTPETDPDQHAAANHAALLDGRFPRTEEAEAPKAKGKRR